MINALLVKVGRDPVIVEIENELEALQKVVGGYIEVVVADEYLDGTQICVICNEEGKNRNMPINFPITFNGQVVDFVVGDALVVYSKDGEFFGNRLDARMLKAWFTKYAGRELGFYAV